MNYHCRRNGDLIVSTFLHRLSTRERRRKTLKILYNNIYDCPFIGAVGVGVVEGRVGGNGGGEEGLRKGTRGQTGDEFTEESKD